MTFVQEEPLAFLVEMKEIESAIKLKEASDKRQLSSMFKLFISYYNPGNEEVFDGQNKCFSVPVSTASSPVSKPLNRTFSEECKEPSYPSFQLSVKPTQQKADIGCKTIMVRNLPEGIVPDDLFKLFGMYGNVMRVKIFFKSPDTALIQFQESEQATLAKDSLNGCPLRNRQISVNLSKTEISFSSNEQSNFYKEYFKQRGQRYRQAGSKNFKNIAKPSPVLHLSNLLPDKDIFFYSDLLSRVGKVAKVTVLKGESRTLLVEMENLEQAVEGLIQFHNYEYNSVFLKVSFSKYNTIKGTSLL